MCMPNRKMKMPWSQLAGVVTVATLFAVAYVLPVTAQPSSTKTFPSAQEACDALFQAVQNGDEQQLETILGAGKEITSSGDGVEDKLEHQQFAKKYQEMHRLVTGANGRTILYIGAENWPFPVPLVSANGVWRFDSDAGKREILFRAIGENEFTAIDVCDGFAAATKYPRPGKTEDDPVVAYAERLASFTSDGVNSASANGTAFHGYYFQAEMAGGRKALIAYPAKYRSSGVMTFLVTGDGILYERDLGPDTATAARNTNLQKPGSSWRAVQ